MGVNPEPKLTVVIERENPYCSWPSGSQGEGTHCEQPITPVTTVGEQMEAARAKPNRNARPFLILDTAPIVCLPCKISLSGIREIFRTKDRHLIKVENAAGHLYVPQEQLSTSTRHL